MISLRQNEQEHCSHSARHRPQTERVWWPTEGRAVLSSKGVSFINEKVFKVLDSIEKQKPSLNAEELQNLKQACEEFHYEPTK
jgi:hypothetical protein